MLLIMLNRDLVSIQISIKSVIFPYLLIINQLSTLSYPLIHSQLLTYQQCAQQTSVSTTVESIDEALPIADMQGSIQILEG